MVSYQRLANGCNIAGLVCERVDEAVVTGGDLDGSFVALDFDEGLEL